MQYWDNVYLQATSVRSSHVRVMVMMSVGRTHSARERTIARRREVANRRSAAHKRGVIFSKGNI